MTALADLAEKIATARAMPAGFGMVVLTVDEAQAVLDEARPRPRAYGPICNCGNRRRGDSTGWLCPVHGHLW